MTLYLHATTATVVAYAVEFFFAVDFEQVVATVATIANVKEIVIAFVFVISCSSYVLLLRLQ